MTTATSQSSLTRVIGILIFAVVPLALVALSVSNFLTWREATAALAERSDLLARFQQRLDLSAPMMKTGNEAILYLDGGSTTLASAALRQRVATAIAAAGGKLIETRAEDATQSDGATPSVSVSVNGTFDIANDGLARFVYDLESGLPLLDIDAVSIRRPLSDTGAEDANPQLRVDMVVRGTRRPLAP